MLILVNCILGCPWFLQRLLEHTNERGTVLYNPLSLIIQKDLDLWKLDFSFLILLYRETCNICNTCSLCSLIHFFWRIPTCEEKLFVHTFHGILSIFLKTPTLFFFIFFRYHFHWYSIRYGNCLRWGSQQLDMNVNNKPN